MKYQVLKVYNNNVVLAKQEHRQVILVSKGIGFGKKTGDILENNGSIEKVFHELNPSDSKTQLKEIDDVTRQLEYVFVQFFKIAQDKLGYQVENKQDTIKEHIEFALSRLKMGLSIDNPFLDEIVTLYKAEYKLAGIARELIVKHMAIDIGEEEQGFIALHLYAARTQKSIDETIGVARIYKDCIDMIQDECQVEIPLRTTLSKQFFANFKILISLNKSHKCIKMPLCKEVATMLKLSHSASRRIAEYLQVEKNICLTEDDIAYLAIDIERLIQSMKVEITAINTEEKTAVRAKKQKVDKTTISQLAKEYIQDLGGNTNIVNLEACTTRLRINVRDFLSVNEEGLKALGAKGVFKTSNNNVQVILGTKAEIIAKEMKKSLL